MYSFIDVLIDGASGEVFDDFLLDFVLLLSGDSKLLVDSVNLHK